MYTVMLVDDEQTAKRSLRHIIRQSCPMFQVVSEAVHAEEALVRLEETMPDVVITDIRMPGADGLELSRQIKCKEESIEIVIVTGYGEFEYAQQAVKFGVTDFLLKPIDPVEVEAALAGIADKFRRSREMFVRRSEQMLLYKQQMDAICEMILQLNDKGALHEFRSMVTELEQADVDSALWQEMMKRMLEHIVLKLTEKSGEQQVQLRAISSLPSLVTKDPAAMERYLLELVELIRSTRNWSVSSGIETVLQMIKHEYNQTEFSLTRAAEYAGMSPTYFSKCFKQETGLSFSDYMTALRMRKAIEILQTTDCKVYEVAHQVGYNEYSHFSKMFKKQYHISPREYRSLWYQKKHGKHGKDG